MPDSMDTLDRRIDRALHAMQNTPTVARDAADRIAARAILANAPAARASLWTRRAAAAVIVVATGATLANIMTRSPIASDAVATVATPDIAPAMRAETVRPPMLPVSATSARPIMFELDAPTAHSVQVLGDFNHWSRDATAMQRGADGRWRITTLLPPGRYIYAYLVDGRRFQRDPVRDAIEDRDFGVTGSELVVSEAP
jgi:Glycogen recognition site of AMP-activated protein kinase